jgi:hypothetical protein
MDTTIKTHLPSVGMLFLSGGGAFLALTSAAGFAIYGLIQYLTSPAKAGDAQVFLNLAATSGLVFIFLLPSTILAAMRLLDKPIPSWHFPWSHRAANLGFLVVPVLIALGFFIEKNALAAALILPWFQLAVVAIPIWWILETGFKDLPMFTPQQGWGLFSISVMVTMPLVILAETILVALVVAGIFVYASFSNPQFFQQMSATFERLANSTLEKESVIRIIRPYITNPATIYSLIAIMAGVIPFLEELLKPLALWFFSPRKLSAREGFIGGMICGAAFALLESLGALGNPGTDSWSIIAIGRVGTGILHVSASGLVGWGMTKAWSEGKYLTLVWSYLLAVSFHALWNTSALMSGLSGLAQFSPLLFGQFEGFILVSPFILVLLAMSLVTWVMKANYSFQQSSLKEAN